MVLVAIPEVVPTTLILVSGSMSATNFIIPTRIVAITHWKIYIKDLI
jgi:hypothetical protein